MARTRCITVTHSSGLYVTDGYIVTHNSALAWQWAIEAARTGVGVLAISMEMTATALGRRALSAASGVPIWKLRRGRHGDDMMDMDALIVAERELVDLPLSIEDGGRASSAEMMLMARLAQRRHGLGLVMVDHLQIARPEDVDVRQGSTAAIAAIAHAMKEMAKRLNCPVLLLSQLNRGLEGRDDHRPNLSDLRQAGAIEEDADVVAFVYRPEMHLSKSPPEKSEGEGEERYSKRVDAWNRHAADVKGVASLIIEKLREGEPTTVKLRFDGPTARFSEPGGG